MKLNKLIGLLTVSGSLAALSLITACASSPKVSKNPDEETRLQSKASEVLAAGPTEGAKAGGYDAVSFWKNRSKVAGSYTKDGELGVLSKSKIVYLLDFRVRFNTYFGASTSGGHGIFDRASDKVSGLGGNSSVTVNEKRNTTKWVNLDEAYYQKIVDSALEDFIKELKAAGYEVRMREQMEYEPMKEYLKSDKMVPSPLVGDRGLMIYSPTGWKMEKSTANPGLGDALAGFGDTLLKLGEQNSRKKTESIGMMVTYDVNLGSASKSQEDPFVKINSEVAFSTTYYTGFIRQTKTIQDGEKYKYSEELVKADGNATGKLFSSLGAILGGMGGEYSTSSVYSVKPDLSDLTPRITQHLGYANDLLFEKIREGRDD